METHDDESQETGSDESPPRRHGIPLITEPTAEELAERRISDYFDTELTFEEADVSYPKTKVKEIEKAFSDLFDIEVGLLERMANPEHIDEVRPSSEFTVEMSDWTDETV